MYQIAVCDDEKSDLQHNIRLTERVMAQAGIPCSIAAYESGQSLLSDVQSGRHFDLLLLDVIMEKLDGMVKMVMGKNAAKFANYIGTIFIFILISNFSGLLGLRPPTADYGVTLPLGLATFTLIHYNKLKHKKLKGALAELCDPWPIWAPINIIGYIAVPVSLSLRLFANVLSGVVMMALVYGLLRVIAIGWPAVLHVYFDLFSGAIQTYVFCMLTMTYLSDAIGEEG